MPNDVSSGAYTDNLKMKFKHEILDILQNTYNYKDAFALRHSGALSSQRSLPAALYCGSMYGNERGKSQL
jgi:hypothetical protein